VIGPGRGTKAALSCFISMMTSIQIVTNRVLLPTALAVAMLLSTPAFGLFDAAMNAPSSIRSIADETVIYETIHSSMAFKS